MRNFQHKVLFIFKEEVRVEPKFSMFCMLSKNCQYFLEK